MDTIYEAQELVARSGGSIGGDAAHRPPIYKVVGLCLAIASGLFIGTSFVLKKVGLLKANQKYNEEAGEGYGYLKNWYWWAGMTLMIIGEICNFVAYAFVDAILVTPLGALSVVVTTILSAIFLKERLSFVGKVGCFNCIIGSVVIVLNAPTQSAVADIQQMKDFVISPGFLSYAGVVIVACTFIALWAGPRYGKKTMLVYISICSLIGGLSVVATQGLGSAVVAQAGGKPQFNQWFLYLLLVFVVATLLTEIIYLNKALNIFNAALVTPTYYVFFTSATIITSAILFRGFKGTPIQIITVVMGFFQICAGVVLLQLSKSSKDVPDAAVFNGDLDQIRQVGEQEQPETDPKADAIRGTAALVRRFSSAREKMERKEFERLHHEKMQDHLEPLRENEIVEWDGLRRRKTIIGEGQPNSIVRRKTLHPPLGMSQFPEEEDDQDEQTQHGLFSNMRTRASTVFSFQRQQSPGAESTIRPVPMTEIVAEPHKNAALDTSDSAVQEQHTFGLPAALRKPGGKAPWSIRSKPLPPQPEPSPNNVNSPPNAARRQFSFSNLLGRNRSQTTHDGTDEIPPHSRAGLASRGSSYSRDKVAVKNATEEERLGLVKGDSISSFLNSSPQPPSYPALALTRSQSVTTTSSQEDDSDYGHVRLSCSRNQHKTYPSASLRNSDKSDIQMTAHQDSNPLCLTTTAAATATATAPMNARSMTTNMCYPPSDRSMRRSIARVKVQVSKHHSPPPTYKQAQAQSQKPPPPQQQQQQQQPQPQSRRQGVTDQCYSGHRHLGHHIQVQGRLLAKERTAQALRDRESGQDSAQQVPEFDPSLISLMNQRQPMTRGEHFIEIDEGQTKANDDIESEGTSVSCRHTSLLTTSNVPTQLRASSQDYETESSMTLEQPVPAVTVARSPEIVDVRSTETKDRFQAQSQRERDRRRTRMSMTGTDGLSTKSGSKPSVWE